MNLVVGVAACSKHIGGEPQFATPARYSNALIGAAGAIPVLLPPVGDPMLGILDHLDGLLLSGSPSNVHPSLYGVAGSLTPASHDPPRDATTLPLARAAIARGLPLLAICRGVQELNVAFGGKLRRDLGSSDGRVLSHHAAPGATLEQMFAHEHEVSLSPNGVLRHSLGVARLRVNSVHYQGIDTLGDGLTIEATADDGVVEAVSAWVGRAPVLAVQWHPEWNADGDPQSAGFFQILGRALRGLPLAVS